MIKEPVTQNPFKLVYQVLKYAIRNKRPRCRSAFTYCEDELPSRIAFGKSKYGGPFTTEQVEYVKAIFRLLPIAFLGCTLLSTVFAVDQLSNRINELIYSQTPNKPTAECYLNNFYTSTTITTAGILMPLYELVVYPVLRKHFNWIKKSLQTLISCVTTNGKSPSTHGTHTEYMKELLRKHRL